eukprot:433987_1
MWIHGRRIHYSIQGYLLRGKHPSHQREYIQALEEVGFVNVTFVDMTDSWSTFVQARYEAFLENKDSFVGIHGLDAFESLSHFFNAMNILFHGDNLGGGYEFMVPRSRI